MLFNKISAPTPNERHQTKQNALKSKNDNIFKKMTKKKKRFHAIILQVHSNANVFYFNECMKSLILNPIQFKKEKT